MQRSPPSRAAVHHCARHAVRGDARDRAQPPRRGRTRAPALHTPCDARTRHKRTIALPRTRARRERRGTARRHYRHSPGCGRVGSQAATRWARTPQSVTIAGAHLVLAPRIAPSPWAAARGSHHVRTAARQAERQVTGDGSGTLARAVSSNRPTPAAYTPSSRHARALMNPRCSATDSTSDVRAAHTAGRSHGRHAAATRSPSDRLSIVQRTNPSDSKHAEGYRTRLRTLRPRCPQ